jgi:hypothetical protein
MEKFTEVAALLSKGPSPEWLARALAGFAEFISTEPIQSDEVKRFLRIIERMHDAADYLIKYLPLFFATPLFDCPEDVAAALAVLPSVKRCLAEASKSRGRGPRPNAQRRAWQAGAGEPKALGNLQSVLASLRTRISRQRH